MYHTADNRVAQSGRYRQGGLYRQHLANFLGEKCFKNHGDAEKAFNEFIASRIQDFFIKLEYTSLFLVSKDV
ncbi:hypothetical protein LAZ67_1006205 [Cordylochernes scorpioides]|uniref:Uncharacterized protein n=1 Tax=Cordylochernes scorpioides TaxID=51811 RepID=A0ABY6JYK8_9ARAC|nr:hypothetical protein LAZ67_1006205 [Cordylochernes scorpioides]